MREVYENKNNAKNVYYVSTLSDGSLNCFIAFKTNCKKRNTAITRFTKWIKSQPYYNLICEKGFMISVYELIENEWHIEIQDDIKMRDTLYDYTGKWYEIKGVA